ncbi:hypothetical protein Fleli_3369 [Bernardetia litoralis DSM 6794]|uniref:Uncharacterized protein n=2 Tax=Bernardetia litoralis TaxID=999 RepID=I4AP08_BERLS|nr:hypothetical protein Fleli_3369 [Bernardetia litoralis DSM 6794]
MSSVAEQRNTNTRQDAEYIVLTCEDASESNLASDSREMRQNSGGNGFALYNILFAFKETHPSNLARRVSTGDDIKLKTIDDIKLFENINPNPEDN